MDRTCGRSQYPWEASTKVASGLQAPVTGLAVDPSGSVFVAEANGLVWIPYSTTTGALNVNSQVLLTSGLGSGPAIPWGVALDGTQNAYAIVWLRVNRRFGATRHRRHVQLQRLMERSIPMFPFEVDAQILNLGNTAADGFRRPDCRSHLRDQCQRLHRGAGNGELAVPAAPPRTLRRAVPAISAWFFRRRAAGARRPRRSLSSAMP